MPAYSIRLVIIIVVIYRGSHAWLIAGVAVPATIGRLVPRQLGITGVALAVVAELSALALPFEHAAFLLPIARFGGLLWLITAAALLPARRATASTPPTEDIQHAHQP